MYEDHRHESRRVGKKQSQDQVLHYSIFIFHGRFVDIITHESI